ncbi:unnamed protein product [Calypogeia fissa]
MFASFSGSRPIPRPSYLFLLLLSSHCTTPVSLLPLLLRIGTRLLPSGCCLVNESSGDVVPKVPQEILVLLLLLLGLLSVLNNEVEGFVKVVESGVDFVMGLELPDGLVKRLEVVGFALDLVERFKLPDGFVKRAEVVELAVNLVERFELPDGLVKRVEVVELAEDFVEKFELPDGFVKGVEVEVVFVTKVELVAGFVKRVGLPVGLVQRLEPDVGFANWLAFLVSFERIGELPAVGFSRGSRGPFACLLLCGDDGCRWLCARGVNDIFVSARIF